MSCLCLVSLFAFSQCTDDSKHKFLRDVYLEYHRESMAVADTMNMHLMFYPEGSNSGIPPMAIWTSSDPSVVSVEPDPDNHYYAVLTAHKVGSVVITCNLCNGIEQQGFKTSASIIVDSHFAMPDYLFMDFCLSHFDKNHDGILQGLEVDDIIAIDVTELEHLDKPISFEGIELFPSLRYFKATHLIISKLDLSKNPMLTDIDISESQIASLDLTNNAEVRYLDCHACPNLTSINFGSGKKYDANYINTINCQRCNLQSLDLSRCGRLVYIDCSNNNLSSLDLSNNLAVQQISCYGNNISQIKVDSDFDVSQLVTLETDPGVSFTH